MHNTKMYMQTVKLNRQGLQFLARVIMKSWWRYFDICKWRHWLRLCNPLLCHLAAKLSLRKALHV